MKITKKSIKASDDVAVVVTDPIISECPECDPSAEIPVVEIAACPYQNAIDLIQAAIESLAEIAKDDEVAKDSIANLAVVMMDLKGGC